jgi:hypothetical protein
LTVIVFVGAVQAQTNFYTTVTNLWYQGYKSNVLSLAEARLLQNTNDIAGLILKAEYDLEFLELTSISNSYERVIQVGDTITTTNFVKRFEWERNDYVDGLDWLKNEPIPANELPAEKAKANIIHKELPTKLIEALQKDGFFNQ